jgi:hypothetical protein
VGKQEDQKGGGGGGCGGSSSRPGAIGRDRPGERARTSASSPCRRALSPMGPAMSWSDLLAGLAAASARPPCPRMARSCPVGKPMSVVMKRATGHAALYDRTRWRLTRHEQLSSTPSGAFDRTREPRERWRETRGRTGRAYERTGERHAWPDEAFVSGHAAPVRGTSPFPGSIRFMTGHTGFMTGPAGGSRRHAGLMTRHDRLATRPVRRAKAGARPVPRPIRRSTPSVRR